MLGALYLTLSVCAFLIALVHWEVNRNQLTCEEITKETGIPCGPDCPGCKEKPSED
jgi:hypothetical protein